MKNIYFLLTFLLISGTALYGQIDYSFSIPFQSDFTICESGNPTGAAISVVLTDAETNGEDTYYEFFSNGLTFVNSTSGLIPDGTAQTLVNIVGAPGLTPGMYTVTVQASSDPNFGSDVITYVFMFMVLDEPEASIGTPDGIYICDGTAINLEADPGPATMETYSWSPGGETSQDVVATSPGTYTVTIGNSCGDDMASVDVLAGAAPEIDGFNCNGTPTANAINVFVDALDPEDIGLTFQWYRDGVEIFDGGDFSINTNQNTNRSTLQVNNVQANHYGAEFHCEISNACGTVITNSCANIQLPVEMVYFSGILRESAVWLEWATATEENSDFFEVQRSYNGIDFATIGALPAAGFSQSEITYTFQDLRPFAEMAAPVVYYRLRQVDIDGAFEYSRLITIEADAKEKLQVEYAVADGGELAIQLFMPRSGKLRLEVIGLNGQVLYENTRAASEGHTQVSLEDLSLPAGLYLLRVSDGFGTDVYKFVW